MCASFNSTLWAKIEKKDETHEIGETNLEYIYSLADNVTKLSIQGGESFYGPEFVDFVDNFPNKENLILDVFTNTITADMKAIKRWYDECKTLLIYASIDGVEEVFEYIRWPGKW
jgi:MoaA/NifB/PqqE/SkfB family radical SAM enzyme